MGKPTKYAVAAFVVYLFGLSGGIVLTFTLGFNYGASCILLGLMLGIIFLQLAVDRS